MLIHKIGMIERTYRHIQRYRQILGVLFRYGFGDLVENLKVEQYLEIGLQMVSRKRREKIETLSRAERVRMALEELGPTFIKMGQILSTRPDLLPVEFIKEFTKLQDGVPPFPFEHVKNIVESELKAPLTQIFEDFDETPLAAASLGQVHRARLASGEVVVKVQRPKIRRTVNVDMEIILHIAGLMERHVEGWDVHLPTKIVEEFAHTLERELDYTIEASHLERFARQFTSDLTVYVPRVYREITTARILTMEYVPGNVKASDIDRLQTEGFDRKEIAHRGAVLIMKQIFIHGFFHADPHPGNILILPNNVICYLDFGMMGRLDRQTRENFADFIMGIALRNESKTADALVKLTLWNEEPDRDALRRDVSEFIDQHFYQPLKELEIGKLLHQLLFMVSKHRMRIPPDLFLMLKALSTVEGLGQILDPNFDMIKHATPFVRRVQLDRLHPRRIAEDVVDSGTEFVRLIKEIPGELREILKQARQGKVKIEFEHRGLEPMLVVHDQISNRLAFAIVLASLIIGSSLIVLAGIPPKWGEIPIIGLLGFLIAAIMGFRLLISILKHGKM